MTTITRGSRVQFLKDGVMRAATVFQITTDIENGRKVAIIELEHELSGNRETVPFDELTAAPLSQNPVLVSGSFDFIKFEMEHRRFVAVSTDNKSVS